MTPFKLRSFSVCHQPSEKSNSTDPCLPLIRVHLKWILSTVYTDNVNMSNIPSAFYWHDPNNPYNMGKIYFYILWTEEAFYIFSSRNSLSRINIYRHVKSFTRDNTTMWPCQLFWGIYPFYLITVFLYLFRISPPHPLPWVSFLFWILIIFMSNDLHKAVALTFRLKTW
jgi:hypothetical protein